MKYFSKTHVLDPVFSKLKFSNNFKTISIDLKTVWINWSRQRLLLKILKHFRLIEKHIGSIETDRGSQNFWEKTQFWKKQRHILEIPQSIEIYEQNAWVCDEMYFKKKVLNLVFPKLRFLTFSINFQASNLFCIKTQNICKLGWSDQRYTLYHIQCLAKSNSCSVCN